MILAETTPLTRKQAEVLQGKIVKGIEALEANLLRFVEGKGWEPLGFGSFLAWWDATVISVRVGPAIRAVVVHELQQPDPQTGRQLTDREAAERLGVDKDTVRKDANRKSKSKINTGENSPKLIMSPPPPVEPHQEGAVEDTPPVIDGEILTDSQQESVPLPTGGTDTVLELNKQVGKARRMILAALEHPGVLPSIPKLILDELIPEIEQKATEVMKQIGAWEEE